MQFQSYIQFSISIGFDTGFDGFDGKGGDSLSGAEAPSTEAPSTEAPSTCSCIPCPLCLSLPRAVWYQQSLCTQVLRFSACIRSNLFVFLKTKVKFAFKQIILPVLYALRDAKQTVPSAQTQQKTSQQYYEHACTQTHSFYC